MAGSRPPRYFYTGRPGVGKSTIVTRIVEEAKRLGCKVGGIAAPEARLGGRRIGFRLVDVGRGVEGWLAKAGYPGPRIGRYGVVVEDVERIGVPALEYAVRDCDVIVIDEIGPMELAVPPLKEAIRQALESQKPLVGVVHRALRSRHPDIYRLVAGSGRIILVTEDNRERLLEEAPIVAEELCAWSGGEGG
ncbi:MAG: NTPase [Desulfurococcales archaeon]|nr:NTPase [Desulfurococcales archaeon]